MGANNINNKIIFIANSHDRYSQEWQLVEEIGEMLQALNKLHRAIDKCDKDNIADSSEGFLKEIADVQIMLWQELYLRNFSKKEFFEVINEKLDREIERIEGS